MKTYISPDGALWAFEDSGSQDHLITEGMRPISEAEANAIRYPNKTAEQIWEKIKTERDTRRFNGGVQVGAHWFRSDAIATSEYNTLALMSASQPENTVLRAAWRTMDGSTVDMTPALVRQILVAGFTQVAAIDDAAQAHRAAMEASQEPASYDFSGGWPQTCAEAMSAQS